MVPIGIGIGGARSSFSRWLTDSVEILRRTSVSDGSGGSTVTETVVATEAANIVAVTRLPQEAEAGGQLVGAVVYTVYLPHGTEVLPSDVLRRGSDRFEVVDDSAAESDGVATVVTVKRVR